MKTYKVRVASIVLIAFALAASARAQFSYTATNIGTFGGNAYTIATGINDSGQITGFSTIGGQNHAFSYSGGIMTDLGTLGGNFSRGAGINDSGQIVGFSNLVSTTNRHGFVYNGGALTDLGIIGSATDTYAYAINNSGQIVGNSGNAPFISDGTTMTDLTSVLGSSSDGYAINDSGAIAGQMNAGGGIHAFVYSGSTLIDIGALMSGNSYAFGINDSGMVVGYSTTMTGTRAFLYDGASVTNLGTLGGGNNSFANDINNAGQIVGFGYTSSFATKAFIYEGSTLVDLNSVTDFSGSNFTTLTNALSINNSGQIVGYGITSGGFSNAFLLTPISLSPVPEPSTYAALCTLGLAALAVRRLRQRHLAARQVATAPSL